MENKNLRFKNIKQWIYLSISVPESYLKITVILDTWTCNPITFELVYHCHMTSDIPVRAASDRNEIDLIQLHITTSSANLFRVKVSATE